MKILLAKPIIDTRKSVHTVHPIGLGYIASALRKNHDVSILDCEKLGCSAGDFSDFISRERPELIGLTAFSHNKKMVQESISIIRDILPDALIVLGGPHINARRVKVFHEFPGIDYAIWGEAERSMSLLADAIQCKRAGSFEDIPGLIYRNVTGHIQEVANVFAEDISQFDPMPYDLLDIRSYFRGAPHGLLARHKEVVSIITSRGCPYPCTFCAGSINNGKKVRYRKIENVIEEIELLTGKYGAREIHIVDDNFTFLKEYALTLCEEIIRHGFNIDFALPNGIRLDKIDEELLAVMRRAGFYSMSFGIESGSDETLSKIKKLETTDFIRKQTALAKKQGFIITGTFIIGFPWETRQDVKATLRFAKSLPLDHAAFGNFIPLPATKLAEDLVRSGELREDYEVPFVFGDITYCPLQLTASELKRLQREGVFTFYFPYRIHNIIGNIRFYNIKYLFRRLLLLLKSK